MRYDDNAKYDSNTKDLGNTKDIGNAKELGNAKGVDSTKAYDDAKGFDKINKDCAIERLVDSIVESYEDVPETSRLKSSDNVNKMVIKKILERMRVVLFPGYYSESKIRRGYVKYMVGEELEFIQYNLIKQVARALGTEEDCEDCPRAESRERAVEITWEFLERIPYLREVLRTDAEAAFEGDPAAQNFDEIIFCYPGLYAIMIYRIAHELLSLGVPLMPRIMTEQAHSKTGIDIHPGAKIGRYFFIDHGTGIVIGETTEIGERVKIYQGVTLGALSTRQVELLRQVKRHPTIEDEVTIYSGSTILGGDTVIGKGAIIGGNTFITESIPAGARVYAQKPELVIETAVNL